MRPPAVRVLLLALAVLLSPPGLAPIRAEPPVAVTHLLRLPTGDGKDTTGALFLPASPPGAAARPFRAGVVVVHGYGGNFYSGSPAISPQPWPGEASPPSP